MALSIPCEVQGSFLYALPREVKYKDKKTGENKSFKVWLGELMTEEQRIVHIQLPDDPMLKTGEVVSLTGYVKYDQYKKDLLFVAVNPK